MAIHLQSGDRVFLKHTGAWGKVSHLSSGDMVMVRIDGDREDIPIHIEDISLQEEVVPKLVPNQKHSPTTIREGTFHGNGEGGWLAVAVDQENQLSKKFHLLLINDTHESLPFEAFLEFDSGREEPLKGEIAPFTWRQIFVGSLDLLNEHPSFILKRWHKEGLRQVALPVYQSRLRAKPIVTRQESTIWLPFPAAMIKLPQQESSAQPIPIKTKKPSSSSMYRRMSITPNPGEKATFETILDLHIEKLVPDAKRLTEAEIYQKQLITFDQYLEKATRMGVPRVYVIHGLGKGKLRDAILERCESNQYVLRAANSYHPLFGFGATEIIFFEEGNSK